MLAALALLLAASPFIAHELLEQQQLRRATATAAVVHAEATATAAAIRAEATASFVAVDAPLVQAAVRHLTPQRVTCERGVGFRAGIENPTSRELLVTFHPLSIRMPDHDPYYFHIDRSSSGGGHGVLLPPESHV